MNKSQPLGDKPHCIYYNEDCPICPGAKPPVTNSPVKEENATVKSSVKVDRGSIEGRLKTIEQKIEEIIDTHDYLELPKMLAKLFKDEYKAQLMELLGPDRHNKFCSIVADPDKYGGINVCDCLYSSENARIAELRKKLEGKVQR